MIFEVTSDVKVTEPPAQNVVGPPAVITGAITTFTVIPADGEEVHPPLMYVTVYTPLVVAV